MYGAGSNQEGQLGLGHCNNTTSFHLLHPFCDHAPIKMLSAGCSTSAALTGSNSCKLNCKCLPWPSRSGQGPNCVCVRTIFDTLFVCVGRGREAVHVGGQLCGSGWFRGRGICSRTQRDGRWGSGGMGLLWVPPLSICHRYNTVQTSLSLS